MFYDVNASKGHLESIKHPLYALRENVSTNALNKESYPKGLTDKNTCSSYSAELNERYISPCGICIKVCPVEEDRILFGRDYDSIYTDKDRFPGYHMAWEHVRAYGGKAP